jgi:hypothetical protein
LPFKASLNKSIPKWHAHPEFSELAIKGTKKKPPVLKLIKGENPKLLADKLQINGYLKGIITTYRGGFGIQRRDLLR